MTGRNPNPLLAAGLAGMARFRQSLRAVSYALLACSLLASCSLSTPSPAGGFHHDFTPRTAGPGLKTTRIQIAQDLQFMDRLEVGALLGQTFGLGRESQIDVVAETRTLWITDYDSALIEAKIEVAGYYLGGQYRSPFPGSAGEGFLRSYFAGAGLGAYGDYVKHVDAHAGVSGGYNGKYFCPFAASAAGFSLPYARKVFTHANPNLGGGIGPPERYRFATAAWLGYELGLESPFGNREKGFRLHMSMGQKIFQMLEDDIVSEHEGVMSPYGLDFQYKMGLSFTY